MSFEQLELFERHPLGSTINPGFRAGFDLTEIFYAYYRCRANKRRTGEALRFEVDFESQLVRLWEELNEGRYRPGPCNAFIVDKPVKREIFAAQFRDRVVHHLVIGKLNPLLDKEFIYDSYACRAGKGSLFGIRRLERFIRQCSANYSRDAYVLRLDIQSFFISVDVSILYQKLFLFINRYYYPAVAELLAETCRVILFDQLASKCVLTSHPFEWAGLPADKSLFSCPPGTGLPIGNLTSQVFANFYLNEFDHYIKHDLKLRFYGRYVDDLVFVHPDRQCLRQLVPVLDEYLAQQRGLRLHPRKIQLQHYTKGVKYLGAVIKPGRTYIGNRTKSNFRATIAKHNEFVTDKQSPDSEIRFPCRGEIESFRSSMNSYLGLLKHYRARRLLRQLLSRQVSPAWFEYTCLRGGFRKVTISRFGGS